jgi:hypothetical protein
VIHLDRRLGAACLAHDPRGDTRHRLAGRYIVKHDRSRSNPRTIADADVAKDLRSGTYQNTIRYLWVAITILLAGPAQSDGMEHRYVVSDHGRFPDDDRVRVINHYSLSDPSPWMNVDTKDLRDTHLHLIG